LVSADKLGRPDLLEAFEVPDTAAARILRLKTDRPTLRKENIL